MNVTLRSVLTTEDRKPSRTLITCQVIFSYKPSLAVLNSSAFVTYRGVDASGADVRVGFTIYDSFNNREFIAAQRMRYVLGSKLLNNMKRILHISLSLYHTK